MSILEKLGAQVYVEGMRKFDEDMKRAGKALDSQEREFKETGKAAGQYSENLEEVSREVIKATEKQRNLVRAEQELKNATQELSRAQKALADNTDPAKQAQLEAAVVKAKDGVKDATTAVKKAGDETKTFGQKIKGAFTEIAMGAAAMMGAILAAKKVFKWGKEGAEILMTRDKLDNLAVSIGTTSDAIINKLSKAMRGLMTDANIVSSATEIISLGLADNEDDVVRLATLVGKLGWDMQTVILTFANNSKMRLDSLGLSVEDVNTRMKAFQERGYDMDKAFDLAVMEAGEAKVLLLGDAADSAVAPFQQLETSVSNITDDFKIWIAQGLLPVIRVLTGAGPKSVVGALDAHVDSLAESGMSWQKYVEEVIRAAEAAGLYAEEVDGQIRVMHRGSRGTNDLTDEFNFLTRAQVEGDAALDSWQRGAEKSWLAAEKLTGDFEGLTAETLTAVAAQYASAEAAALQAQEAAEAAEAVREQAEAAAAIKQEFDDLNVLISGKLGPTIEAFNEKQGALRDKITEVTGKIDILASKTYLTPEQEEELAGLRVELGEIKQDVMGNAEAHEEATRRILFSLLQQRAGIDGISEAEMQLMNDVALAWGLIDEETYLAVQAIDGYLEELAEDGVENLDEVTESVKNIGRELRELPMETRIKVIMERVNYVSTYEVSGGSLVPGEDRQHGGPVSARRTYLVGERGPELFVPQTSGRIIPNHAFTDARQFNLTTQSVNRPGTLAMEFFEMEMDSR